ncbi:MAG: PilZ domain-containing protein [Thermodesulfobacteriota bacterium]
MKLISVAKFKGHKHSLKVKCTCGESFAAALDFRERYRKSTNLDAKYGKLDRVEKIEPRMKCKIADLSLSGLALSISGSHDLRVGDDVMVQFNLDDQVKTEIKRRVTVRSIGQGFVGCQFAEADSPAYDKALGFYLMP